MADHARTQIRDKLKTTLTGLATTGALVHVSRSIPTPDADLPVLLISLDEEQVLAESTTIGDKKIMRELLVRIVAAATTEAVADRALAEVETAIGADDTLGGLIKRMSLLGVEVSIDGVPQRQVVTLASRWRVLYRTTSADPTVLIQ